MNIKIFLLKPILGKKTLTRISRELIPRAKEAILFLFILLGKIIHI
jgi:hypothetical protein